MAYQNMILQLTEGTPEAGLARATVQASFGAVGQTEAVQYKAAVLQHQHNAMATLPEEHTLAQVADFGKTLASILLPPKVRAFFCNATLCHLALETTVVPDAGQWLAVLLLGLGPVGAAFFAWDHGTKHGNIQALGAFSYAAPLLSTLVLIAFGKAEATWVVGFACLLIAGGAVLASKELLQR